MNLHTSPPTHLETQGSPDLPAGAHLNYAENIPISFILLQMDGFRCLATLHQTKTESKPTNICSKEQQNSTRADWIKINSFKNTLTVYILSPRPPSPLFVSTYTNLFDWINLKLAKMLVGGYTVWPFWLQVSNTLKTYIPFDLVIPLLWIYPKKIYPKLASLQECPSRNL